jgi:hypothetical protein
MFVVTEADAVAIRTALTKAGSSRLEAAAAAHSASAPQADLEGG